MPIYARLMIRNLQLAIHRFASSMTGHIRRVRIYVNSSVKQFFDKLSRIAHSLVLALRLSRNCSQRNNISN